MCCCLLAFLVGELSETEQASVKAQLENEIPFFNAALSLFCKMSSVGVDRWGIIRLETHYFARFAVSYCCQEMLLNKKITFVTNDC